MADAALPGTSLATGASSSSSSRKRPLEPGHTHSAAPGHRTTTLGDDQLDHESVEATSSSPAAKRRKIDLPISVDGSCRSAVAELESLQAEILSLEERCAIEQITKQTEAETKRRPYLLQRSLALRKIPQFWRHVFESLQHLAEASWVSEASSTDRGGSCGRVEKEASAVGGAPLSSVITPKTCTTKPLSLKAPTKTFKGKITSKTSKSSRSSRGSGSCGQGEGQHEEEILGNTELMDRSVTSVAEAGLLGKIMGFSAGSQHLPAYDDLKKMSSSSPHQNSSTGGGLFGVTMTEAAKCLLCSLQEVFLNENTDENGSHTYRLEFLPNKFLAPAQVHDDQHQPGHKIPGTMNTLEVLGASNTSNIIVERIVKISDEHRRTVTVKGCNWRRNWNAKNSNSSSCCATGSSPPELGVFARWLDGSLEQDLGGESAVGYLFRNYVWENPLQVYELSHAFREG
eukprot:g2842.t1